MKIAIDNEIVRNQQRMVGAILVTDLSLNPIEGLIVTRDGLISVQELGKRVMELCKLYDLEEG